MHIGGKLAEVAAKERRGADRAWWLKSTFRALYLAQTQPHPAVAAWHHPDLSLKPKPPRANDATSRRDALALP